ncbi:hypothetical protein DRQ33_03525 [bacterium]|nr:MAG: hypothetical protein DRQ33_03525 [bacterium]
MGYRFDKKGFLLIPDPRERRLEKQAKDANKPKCLVVNIVYCPNGHSVMDDYVNFNSFSGIKLKIHRPNGEQGVMVLSPIFGDKSVVFIGTKPKEGEKLEVFCPHCEQKIPILQPCENCDGGEIRVLSLDENFDITNGIAFCDLVGCPSAFILHSGELIEQAYLEGLE